MDKRKNRDEISELLDSFHDDDTLEQKMNAFEENKEKQTRLKREEQRRQQYEKKEIDEIDVTRIIDPISDEDILEDTHSINLHDEDESEEAGKTVMWNPDDLNKEEPTESNETVVIDDEEIQSLLGESQGPILQREVVNKNKSNRKKKSNSKKNIGIYVVMGLISLLLVGFLVFGIVQVVSNSAEDKISEEEQKENYKEILDWAKHFDPKSSSDKKKLIKYEKKYNQLTNKQKKEIDKILKDVTGSNFDTLLAKEKSGKKENSRNNNTEVAENKARLRNQLSLLKDKLNAAKQDLQGATSDYNTAKSNYDSLTSQINSANSATINAQNELDNAKNAYDENISRIQELQNMENSDMTEELMDELHSRISQSQSLYDSWTKAQQNYDKVVSQNNVASLQNKQAQAQSLMDAAKSAIDEAQGRIDTINGQIAEVQSEIDSL